MLLGVVVMVAPEKQKPNRFCDTCSFGVACVELNFLANDDPDGDGLLCGDVKTILASLFDCIDPDQFSEHFTDQDLAFLFENYQHFSSENKKLAHSFVDLGLRNCFGKFFIATRDVIETVVAEKIRQILESEKLEYVPDSLCKIAAKAAFAKVIWQRIFGDAQNNFDPQNKISLSELSVAICIEFDRR